jgi:hypothetical protein
MEIGTLTIREEGQGNTRKVKPHNNQPKRNVQAVMSTLQACVLQTGQDTTQTGQEHNERRSGKIHCKKSHNNSLLLDSRRQK